MDSLVKKQIEIDKLFQDLSRRVISLEGIVVSDTAIVYSNLRFFSKSFSFDLINDSLLQNTKNQRRLIISKLFVNNNYSFQRRKTRVQFKNPKRWVTYFELISIFEISFLLAFLFSFYFSLVFFATWRTNEFTNSKTIVFIWIDDFLFLSEFWSPIDNFFP